MKFKLTSQTCILLLCCLVASSGFGAASTAWKFEASLIWATNSENSPNRNHKPVDRDVRRKLAELPLKWANYFVVTNVPVAVGSGGSGEAVLSEKCKIAVKDVNGKFVEVSLIGRGEPVLKRTQSLAKGELLVLGGNAPDSTGWLVVLKRTE